MYEKVLLNRLMIILQFELKLDIEQLKEKESKY